MPRRRADVANHARRARKVLDWNDAVRVPEDVVTAAAVTRAGDVEAPRMRA